MILYPRQAIYVHMLAQFVGREDIHCEKSRETGVSWCALYVLGQMWLFVPRVKFMLVSWKEKLVYNAGDMDALFQKLEFWLNWLPPWMKPVMRPRHEWRRMMALNPDNGAVFTGEATVSNIARAGRVTAILLDEAGYMDHLAAILESTTDSTDCRIIQSTVSTSSHPFATERHRCPNRFRFWWPDHPVKARGLTGVGLLLKPASGWWSDDVEGLRGKLSSPWFEMRCARPGATPGDIARNVEIDDTGTGFRFFPEELLRKITVDHSQPPLHEGEIVDGRFQETERLGRLQLWFHPLDGKPLGDRRFVAGCDIAEGTADSHGRGISNSCAVFFDGRTGELVAEYTVHGVTPDDFARAVVPICEWFSVAEDCFLAWEANGPGQFFRKVVIMDLGYSSIYYRQQEKRAGRPQTCEPGWWSVPATKYLLFSEYLQALKEGHMIERNLAAIHEMRQYQTGAHTVYHVAAESTSDPTQAKDQHGDRVVARAVAWRALQEIGYVGVKGLPEGGESSYDGEPQEGSFAWLRTKRINRDPFGGKRRRYSDNRV